MDKTSLVSVDVEKGSKILRILDGANLKIRVALWVHFSEYEDWRLVVSSREFDRNSLAEAYRLVNNALEEIGMPVEITPPIMILEMNNPFIRGLRKIFGKAKSVEGMRLGGQTIGDRFVEDAYVYRIS